MGSSPSIAELQAREDQFKKYLQTLQDDLAGKAENAETAMRKDIDSFYQHNNFDDATVFVSGKSTDFLHEKEFTAENLKKIIDAISAAVFSGGAAPKGTSTNPTAVEAASAALGPAIGAISNLELYIAGKVFDVLSNIVLSFGTGTSIAYTSSTKSQSLGYGLQMFTSVAASSYRSESYFVNEYISQYLYMYEIRFSVKQAQNEAAMGMVQLYQNELARFEAVLNQLGGKFSSGAIDFAAYESTSAKYLELIDSYEDRINKLKSEKRAQEVRATAAKVMAA
ncbi:hypothetical protein KBZ21_29235 [Streptomyces sp. A73]|uniref:hypothetical protein n=1 Tax=Streptomyces sp. RK75 TaxID=2824895 RepID=UPI000C18E9EA|nr:hypothetical protein [Streptomyces sp. RK75]MBQ0864059.1 hypothetical protein [Streptomyces sp. RK75]MBQ1162121.1 hypothetical protein [Streptomyces sp. A73]